MPIRMKFAVSSQTICFESGVTGPNPENAIRVATMAIPAATRNNMRVHRPNSFETERSEGVDNLLYSIVSTALQCLKIATLYDQSADAISKLLILLRRVFLFIPSNWAALTLLPPVTFRASSIKGRSTMDMTS